jgi:hypothetical protein
LQLKNPQFILLELTEGIIIRVGKKTEVKKFTSPLFVVSTHYI